MNGPGKYDKECSEARKATKAVGVALIVIGGDRGHGFSVQAPDNIIRDLPRVLRHIIKELQCPDKPQIPPSNETNPLFNSSFKSFQEKQTFEFPQTAGLYQMSGKNLVNPELGGNATGKSTFWGAIVWCLFGKTERGLRASSIVNWEETDATIVEFCFEKEGRRFKIVKSQNPNSLSVTIDGGESSVVTQEALEKSLGFSYQTFLHVALMGQFNQFFFDLSSSDKLSVFAEALGLDYWVERSELAGDKAKEVSETITCLVNDLERVRGNIEAFKKTKDNLIKSSETWEDQTAQEKEMIAEKIKDAQTGKRYIEVSSQFVIKRVCKLEGKRKKAERRQNSFEKHGREVLRDLQTQSNKLIETNAALKVLNEKIDALKKAGSKCPLCEQNLHHSVCADIIESTNLLVAWEEGEKGRTEEKIKELRSRQKDLDKQYEEQKRLVSDLDDKIDKLKDEQTTIQFSLRDKEKEIVRLKEGLSGQNSNPYTDQLESVRKDLKKLNNEFKEFNVVLDKKRKYLGRLQQWAKLFKELRLWIIDEALVAFQVECNNALCELGLNDWKIEFGIERQNKSGTVTRGFQVFITPPGTNKPIEWESFSGGETQRLRLAGAAGFSSLLRGHCGIDISFEVFDEPTTHLSEEGVEDLLLYFSNRARSLNRQSWLVENRALEFAGFDAQVIIQKTKRGSKIVV